MSNNNNYTHCCGCKACTTHENSNYVPIPERFCNICGNPLSEFEEYVCFDCTERMQDDINVTKERY